MPHAVWTKVLLVGTGTLCLACAGASFAPPQWRGDMPPDRWRTTLAGVAGASALVFAVALVAERRRRSAELEGMWSELQFQVDGLDCEKWNAACLGAMEMSAAGSRPVDVGRTFEATTTFVAVDAERARPAAPTSPEPAVEVGSPPHTPAAIDDRPALVEEIASLRERVVRFEVVEQAAAAAERQVEALRATLAEREAAFGRESAERAARTQALERETERLRGELAEVPALRDLVSRTRDVDEALLARLGVLERQASDAEARARSVEEALRQVEEARREAQRQHATELERLATRHEALRRRAAESEEAVRTALRELGVDPANWPLTAAGVVRAVGPLTLCALGERAPGWRPQAPEDTLAAAVIDLVESRLPLSSAAT